jgi:hypothetical protein
MELVFLIFALLLFGTFIWMRWLAHKEKMAMIAQGLQPNDNKKSRRRRRGGCWLLGIGIGLSVLSLALLALFTLFARLEKGDPNAFIKLLAPAAIPALLLLFLGIGLILIHLLSQRNEDAAPAFEGGEDEDPPAPVAIAAPPEPEPGSESEPGLDRAR